MTKVISVEHVTKKYDLGVIGSGTLGRDLNRWWARVHRQPDPEAKIRQKEHFENLGESILALDDVNITVQQGETVGIIGRNGAGKSTLLKILSRVTAPTIGRVKIKGRIGSLLEVGTGFHPELTGRENVFLNSAIMGMKKAEAYRKFDEIVEFSGVEKYIDTPVKRYSSGMYVRLAFAVAAHLEPEILILDEVLAVGDVEFQKKCLGKMGDAAEEGRTVLFVSHNMQAIRQLCRRAIWLHDGQMLLDSSSNEVVQNYLQSLPKGEALLDAAKLISQFPPDPVFRLRSVEILQTGNPVTDVVSGKPLEIRIAYEVFRETCGLHVYFMLYDSEGGLLFESLHNGDADEIPTVLPGNYLSVAVIPADFLSPVRYELQIMASIHNVRRCLPQPVRIPLNVHASGRVNRAYPGLKTEGKLSPYIHWITGQLL